MLAVLVYNVVIVDNNHPNHKCHPANKVDVGQPLGQAGYSLLKILPHIYTKGEHKIGSMLLYNAFCLHNSTVNATLKHLISPHLLKIPDYRKFFGSFFTHSSALVFCPGFPVSGTEGVAVCISIRNPNLRNSRLPEVFRKFFHTFICSCILPWFPRFGDGRGGCLPFQFPILNFQLTIPGYQKLLQVLKIIVIYFAKK